MSHYDKETGLIKISWSKIRLAEECKQKAFLVSEGKKPTDTDVRNYFHGNVVDQAMRRWLGMPDHPAGWMAARVDEIMDELEQQVIAEGDGVVRWRHRDDRQQVREFCRTCATRLEDLLRRVALPNDYQPALRFSTPMTVPGLDGSPVKILLNGEMDLLTREIHRVTPELNPIKPPRLRVWDLKATKDADYWRKTVAQLVFYDIVCMCMFGAPTVEVGLLQPMVEGQPYISFSPSDEDRTQMCTRIVRVAQDIMRGDNRPKADTTGCNWCEVRGSCSRYKTTPGTHEVPLF